MWQRFNTTSLMPLYLMSVPSDVMHALRSFGFHDGYCRPNNIDSNLEEAFRTGQSHSERDSAIDRWLSFICRESCILNPGYPTLWHPRLTAEHRQYLRTRFGDRLIEIEAGSVDDAMHLYKLTKWAFGHFFHCAAMGNWMEVLEEQLALMKGVGLTWVYVGFLGTDSDRKHFESRAKAHCIEVDVKYHHDDVKMYETPTIRLIADWARAHPNNYCLYWHTKGVSNPDNVIKIGWRRLMQRKVVHAWRRNAELLKNGLESIGVNWISQPLNGHWPGNFWMSKASYINSLQEFSLYYWTQPGFNSCRLASEFWHGAGPQLPRIGSLVSINDRIHELARIHLTD